MITPTPAPFERDLTGLRVKLRNGEVVTITETYRKEEHSPRYVCYRCTGGDYAFDCVHEKGVKHNYERDIVKIYHDIPELKEFDYSDVFLHAKEVVPFVGQTIQTLFVQGPFVEINSSGFLVLIVEKVIYDPPEWATAQRTFLNSKLGQRFTTTQWRPA